MKIQNLLKIALLTMASAGLLTGCSEMTGPPGSVDSLQGLKEFHAPNITPRERNEQQENGQILSQIRFTAVKQTALSLGARAGLAWRSKQIDKTLKMDEPVLDKAYNFYGLMLPHDILPPVLVEARNTLNLAGPNTIRLSSQVYKIKSQARFVTAAPTWRDYIWMDYPPPQRPDDSLLPKTKQGQKVWNHYVEIGWNNGIKQADNIFDANLARLNQDYKGMVLYLRLRQENMVSSPYVAKTNLGITGNGSEMSINDKVLRITALPQLNLKSSTWKPIIVPDPLAKYKLNLMKQIYPKMGSAKAKQSLFVK